ncbi:MAG: hypothetical protein KR126chlam1_00531 [Chlamydiae bacterium]|nr:hypothetical protein [Chlamydiota bacterium]
MLEDIFDLEGEKALAEGLFNPFCFRAKRRAVHLADHLLNDQGEIEGLAQAIELLKTEPLTIAGVYDDGEITQHFLRVLTELNENPLLLQKLFQFGLPLTDSYLEKMIAATIGIEPPIDDRAVIWAVLSALLCPLRQSVGSCFATAPAIIVHEEQSLQFLDDLSSLLYKGLLTRVVAGEEYSVPVSPSPGLGDLKHPFTTGHPAYVRALAALGHAPETEEGGTFLSQLEIRLLDVHNLTRRDWTLHKKKQTPKGEAIEGMEADFRVAKAEFVAFSDHLLLKTWEFTLASFVDVKTEFSSWNLFSSLGFQEEEPGGIGDLLYRDLKIRLDEANEKLSHFQQEYEISFDQVRATQHLLKGASNEAEGRRLRAEHTARMYHLNACEEMRDKWSETAHNIANFFSFFLNTLFETFPEYFQEVYDGEMFEMGGDAYDDSPAGFRLICKHGRTHVGSWTFIREREEYITALKEFFHAVEPTLVEKCEWEEGKTLTVQLITTILHHISTEEFILTAFARMAKAHRLPLKKITMKELETLEKKPWAYTSGGTLPTLLRTYFRREGSLTEEKRWVESPEDLLIFLLETLKALPPFVTEPFDEDSAKRMLMTSPTHAFSLLPGESLFKKGWQDSGFTYTWVRDQIIRPARRFYRAIKLDPREQLLLMQGLAKILPPIESHDLQKNFHPSDKTLSVERLYTVLLKHLTPMKRILLDRFLFQALPLSQEGLTRRELHDQLVSEGFTHAGAAQKMQDDGATAPTPLIFADTNWPKTYFAFLVHPAGGDLELWQTDRLGLSGIPMREWAPYLNGTMQENWSVFTRPHEYRAI